tara:strand:- start:809 stop:1600 length:792 start_codon:yes stop_codon:yes gene_type:complete
MFLLVFCVGYFIAHRKTSSTYEALLLDQEVLQEGLKVTSNEIQSLDRLLAKKDEETRQLKEVIQALEERPERIRYVVRTETVIEGSTETTTDLPPSYVHRFANDLAVAQFFAKDDGYTFETFSVDFSTQIVLGENTTGVVLTATSSYEPDVPISIPIQDVEVIKVRPNKLFEPHILIGGTISIPDLDTSLSISTALLHPRDYLDVLSLRGSVSDSSVRIGLDPVSYNLGYNIPVITDLWITAGASIGTGRFPYNFDLTVGSKL